MALIVYLDETGDHSLELIDRGFPIFALVMPICDLDEYRTKIVPAVYQLKMDYFGHEAVILHSRDIRKAQGDFGFLTDPSKRSPFYDRINRLMQEPQYTLIASVIQKQEHKDRYGMWAENPYDLALKFALERLLPLLEEAGQQNVKMIAESRGAREDDELRLSFFRIINRGTEYIRSDRFKKIDFAIEFKPKAMTIVGTQIADLAAYPIAKYVLDPKKLNPAFQIIQKKFYRGKGRIHGFKTFP